MGEKSKSLGELGETVVIENVVKRFGWRGTPNLSVNCHQRAKHNKITHGVDFFACHNNPLLADSFEALYISVKNTLGKSIKSNFKNHSKDLIETSDCFRRDAKFISLTTESASKKIEHKPILFWLNHAEEKDHSLISKIGNSANELGQKFNTFYLVDNSIVDFHYSCLNFIDHLFKGKAKSTEYFYPHTGLNESIYEGRRTSGKVLPVQLLNSPVIPFKIVLQDDKKILLLALNEKFEEDSLKRLTGLAQNLTSGWCNKIILCFPDYRVKDHKTIKDTVMLKFSENSFSDMIEVKNFIPSFRSYENTEEVEFSKVIEADLEFNIEKMLPFGDSLRQLLIQSYINKSDLQRLLGRRGVYVHKSLNKEDLIPLLTTTLISPSEFEFLRRRQISKSNSERISTDHIITDTSEAINQTILDVEVPLTQITKKIDSKIEITNIERFAVNPDGSIRLKVETKNSKLTKDWALSNTNNHTEIIIMPPQKYGKDSKARVDIVASSPENIKIGKQIIDHCLNHLKKNGNLRKDIALERTYSNEFDNINRTKLLFSFLNISKKESKTISFRSLTHLEFNISKEKSTELPDDLSGFKGKVEQLIFSGHNLQEIKYINDPRYHDVLIFNQVIADFNFKLSNYSGSFEVEYGFPKSNNEEDIVNETEFEFKILGIHPFTKKNLTSKQYHDLEVKLRNDFTLIKLTKIDLVDKKYGKQLKLI